MVSDSHSFESTDSFTGRLLRPWSFVAQSSGVDVDCNKILSKETIEEHGRQTVSNSAWCRFPSHLRRSLEAEPTTRPSGWWHQQMLFDRTLRSMAALMTLYAVIMIVICASYFQDFLHRGNPYSTSVGRNHGKSCKSLQSTEIVGIARIYWKAQLT